MVDSPGAEALVRKFYEEFWNNRRFDLLGQIVSGDCLLHFGERSHTMLSEKSRAAQEGWVKSFPDLRFTVVEVVEDGETAAVRLYFEGTQLGDFEGVPPSGKRIHVTEMLFARVREGRICEMWEDYDKLGMMKQLGYQLASPK